MAARRVKYYFGRFNTIGVYTNKFDFVLTGLSGGKLNTYARSEWGFFEINPLEFEQEQYITGYLVKYKPQTEEEVVVHETQQIEEESVQNRVVAKSRFFLHISSGVIAYHPISGTITPDQFRKHFAELFVENHDAFFVQAEIQTIEEDQSLVEALRRFDYIYTVNIYLHPSNPNNRPIWGRTDDRLKVLDAGSYHEKIEARRGSDTNGLNVLEDEETVGKIVMADDGYGEASVEGIIDGKEQKISTKDNPVIHEAPNDEESTNVIMHSLKSTFDKIKSRFNHR